MPEPRILGIIPARRGSKGVPQKNTRLIAGKSLIQRAYETAADAGVLHRIVLSSDDPDAIDLAGAIGLEAPFVRPPELATDETPMMDVVLHAIEVLRGDGYQADAVMLLQPTSPLRTPGHIRRTAELLEGFDAVITVVALPKTQCPHYLLKMRPDGTLDFFLEEGRAITRRQAVPQAFMRDGTIYLTRTSVLIDQRSFLGRRCRPLILDASETLSIDDPRDWEEAGRRLSADAAPADCAGRKGGP